MKLLFAIPHFYKPKSMPHGSGASLPVARIQALTELIVSIHQLFGSNACEIDIARKAVVPVGGAFAHEIDIVLCTTGDNHLIDELPVSNTLYKHHPTQTAPLMLGFEGHKVLASELGRYDYYCFLEDDIVIQDGFFFEKIGQFNRFTDVQALLQP